MKYAEYLKQFVGEKGSLSPFGEMFEVKGGSSYTLAAVEEDFVVFQGEYDGRTAVPVSLLRIKEKP